MKLSEDYINGVPGNSLVASGWVELEGFLKFPVKLRSRKDNSGMFVSYPQRKNKNNYENVIYPHDKRVRKEIEEHVMDAFYKEIAKGEEPEIEGIRVTVVKDKGKNAPVILRGIATLKIAGMTINGIMIKESEKKGLFVEMPQHKSGENYKDTVYATNTEAQWWIRHEVEYAYKMELEKMMGQVPTTLQENKQEVQPQMGQEELRQVMPDDYQDPIRQGEAQEEQMQAPAWQQTQEPDQETGVQPVQETGQEAEVQTAPGPETQLQPERPEEIMLDKIFQAYENRQMQEMMENFKEAELKVEQAKFTENGNAVEIQHATLEAGNRFVHIYFRNTYNPIQVTVPEGKLWQTIEARLFKDGKCIGMPVLMEKKSRSLKNAQKNYQGMLDIWKDLTKQESIEFEKPKQQKKQKDEQVKERVPKIKI